MLNAIYSYGRRSLSLFVLFSLFLAPGAALAIGQVTTPIVQEGLLQGQEFSVEILPYNSADTAQAFVLQTTGAVDGWATFYAADDRARAAPISEISVAAKSYARALAVFKVPDGTPNGLYQGGVVVAAKPAAETGEEGTSTTVTERVSRQVRITVTDQENVAFNVIVIPKDFDVPSGGTLDIRFIYENNGNVNVRPDARLKILKDGKVVSNAIYSYPEAEEPVKVRTRKDMSYLAWPATGQPTGHYRAELEFMVNGQIYDQDGFRFTVGIISAGALLAALGPTVSNNWALVPVALGVALLAFSLWARFRPANNHRGRR